MSRIDRIYRIHEILRSASRPVPMRRFMEELEASRNTVTRDFEYLRDFLGAPLIYNRERNGHEYDPEAPQFELPGFWMSAGELYALLACEQLLESVQPGMMAHRLAPLKGRIRHLLGQAGHDAETISERIQIQPIQVRNTPTQVFDPVAEATLAGRQLRFDYASRSRQRTTTRITHPQRLLHYRSNWYLLAHCETAQETRIFSLDRIAVPIVLDKASQSLPKAQLDHFTDAGFGIFGGEVAGTAHLLFSDHAAEWVAEEQWHPDQVGQWLEDGYHLNVPYADMRELVMDILRHGPNVEVLAPAPLRDEVARRIREMHRIY